MEVFTAPLSTIVFFAGFGVLVGILFGFFGMGSFMVTPTLLVLGYESTVAVGSGLAFVFGTAVIATLKHRELGQVDYRLGVVTIVGTTLGIEVGKRGLLALREMGVASVVVSTGYVFLLGMVGTMVLLETREDARDGNDPLEFIEGARARLRAVAGVLERPSLPPKLSLRDGGDVSVWTVLAITFTVGVPAGLLGIGGGFMRIPALLYLVGTSMPVAVGTNVFSLTISGAIGSFSWAYAGGVDLSIVAPLLLGSGLGARIGSHVTKLVEADAGKRYFGGMLVASAVAVSIRHVGERANVDILRVGGVVLIVGSAVVVAGAILYAGVRAVRTSGDVSTSPAD
ncbi:MAG: sulfite exporter TauE/SafE family protein [Halanaeroarchaeum sp.]